MTWGEFTKRCEIKSNEEQDKWDITRNIVAAIYDVNSKKRITARDVMPLPRDIKTVKPSTVNEFEEAKRKLRDAKNSGISSTAKG